MNKILILLLILILIYNNKIYFFEKIENFSGKKMLKNTLNKTLVQIVKDFQEYNIKNWFIGYGTLLGIIRNDSCIDNDDDIDIIISNNESKKLHKLIKEKNYKYDKMKNDKIYKLKNFTRIILGIDLAPIDFYIAEDNNGNYNDTWEKVVWSNINPIKKKNWSGVKLNLPNNYIEKLKNRYGKDWRTPRNWKGPRNKKIL